MAIDLFCGLGGWTDGLLAENYRVIGFDIEEHVYGSMRYPAQLVIQDVLTLHGAQFRDAAATRADPALLEKELALFKACFRIQREACKAAGRHVPLVVENVRGAEPWVGRARWNFGSFYLWGDVPALMPPTLKAIKVPGFRFDGSGRSFQSASVESHVKAPGGANIRDGARYTPRLTNPAEGVKQGGSGHAWFDKQLDERRKAATAAMRESGRKRPGVRLSEVGFNVSMAREVAPMLNGAAYRRTAEDKRQHLGIARKAASAMIAKIPITLSRHIAAVYRPAALTALRSKERA